GNNTPFGMKRTNGSAPSSPFTAATTASTAPAPRTTALTMLRLGFPIRNDRSAKWRNMRRMLAPPYPFHLAPARIRGNSSKQRNRRIEHGRAQEPGVRHHRGMTSSGLRTVRTMCPMNCHPTLCGMLAAYAQEPLAVRVVGVAPHPKHATVLDVDQHAAQRGRSRAWGAGRPR